MNTNDICDRLLDQAKEFPAETIPADPESEDSTKWVEQVVLSPEAQKIVDDDPSCQSERYQMLWNRLRELRKTNVNWAAIS